MYGLTPIVEIPSMSLLNRSRLLSTLYLTALGPLTHAQTPQPG